MSFGNKPSDDLSKTWPSCFASRRRGCRDEVAWETSKLYNYCRDQEAAAEESLRIFMLDDSTETNASRRDQEAAAKESLRIFWLDDRPETKANREMKPYHKPLTASQLKDQLRRRRYDPEFPCSVRGRSSIEGSSSKNYGAKELHGILSRRRHILDERLELDDDINSVSDAERRMIFLTDLGPSTLEALMTTASLAQVPPPKDLLYKYLTNKTSVQVNVPDQEFACFALSIHIPYYVFKVRNDIPKNTRKKTCIDPRDLNTEKLCDSQEDLSTHFLADEFWSRSNFPSRPGASQPAKGTPSKNICIDWFPQWKKRFGDNSWMEGSPGSGLLEHIDSRCLGELIDLLLAAFKALLNFSADRMRTPGRCRKLTFPFLLLLATPVAADLFIERSAGSPVRPYTSNLENEVKNLLSKTVMPWLQEVEIVSSPEALLIACFLCTASMVFLVAIRRQDYHQKYFFAVGFILSAIAGVKCSRNIQDFVFRYLFGGLNISLLFSFLYHAYGAPRDNSFKESLKHGVCGDQDLELEAGNLTEEKI